MLLSTCLTSLASIPIITAHYSVQVTTHTTDVTSSSSVTVISSSVVSSSDLSAISSSTTVQDVSSTATSCSTHFTFVTTPTGSTSEQVPTTFKVPITTTRYLEVTTTTRDTISVTPSATTFTDTVTTTTTFTTTTTSVPPTVTVPTSPGFFPLIAAETNAARIKRFEIEGRRNALTPGFSKRQQGSSGGFGVDDDGVPSDARFKKTTGVECQVVVSVNRTTTTIVTDPPETVVVAPQVATSVVTSTVSTTETVTTVVPTPTIYAACGSNNVVDEIRQWNGRTLSFTQVTFDGENGIPDNQIVLVNTNSGTSCCVACQLASNCAASGYIPTRSQCRLLLTEPPPPASNNTAVIDSTTFMTATASGVMPMATGGPPAVMHSNSTCSRGSMSKYVGTIEGRENFNPDYAITFSNGPCGRLDVWPIPLSSKKMALI
ncbi:hypothetical protein IQ07DRAFT_586881 [Pyrenochaeta sp. DS3sAY3a]|nr:hypothetical protein IQ07DRAFT_586881 [Pyrenochaeta sp. DS3sAY3a]